MRQVVHTRETLFTKQYKLLLTKALTLGRWEGLAESTGRVYDMHQPWAICISNRRSALDPMVY